MKILNKYNLPQTFVNAVSEQRKPQEKRYSITDLINPPLMRYLKIKHWDDIEMDISDMLWLILGSAVHYILEKGSPIDSLAEEKLEVLLDWGGELMLVGKPDLWHDGIISDYKITSVYSFLLGDKPEWERQLNCYRWLYKQHGFDTTKLEIHAILRDWTKSKAIQDHNYPKIPFITQDIEIWDMKKIRSYIDHRVEDLLVSEKGIINPCSPEERWHRPDKYAVMKEGRKTALRVLESLNEAENWISLQGIEYSKESTKIKIEKRLGSDIRCDSYCQVRDFCEAKDEKTI